MKNTLNEERLKQALTEEDKTTIQSNVDETLQWLEGNHDAEADVIEGKQKELEAKLNPIMQRIYQAAGGANGMQEGMGGAPEGPKA